MRYLLENISLINGNTSSIDSRASDICKLIKDDFGCFKIVNRFFLIHRDNSITKAEVETHLESYKEELELFEGIYIDRNIYAKVVNLVKSLFENVSVDKKCYIKIYSDYLEYLVKLWQNIPGPNGRVEIEPTIYYDAKIFFEGEDYCNSKCDIVYLNVVERHFKLYECKFGLRHFIANFSYSGSESKVLKQHRKVLRKMSYMHSFHDLFLRNQFDVLDGEIAFVTLASRTMIQNEISLLSPSKFYTIEDIETHDFFGKLYC